MRVGEAGAGAGYFTFFLSALVGERGVVYANDNDAYMLAALEHYAIVPDLGVVELGSQAGYRLAFYVHILVRD